jgi:hypothetical protein
MASWGRVRLTGMGSAVVTAGVGRAASLERVVGAAKLGHSRSGIQLRCAGAIRLPRRGCGAGSRGRAGRHVRRNADASHTTRGRALLLLLPRRSTSVPPRCNAAPDKGKEDHPSGGYATAYPVRLSQSISPKNSG